MKGCTGTSLCSLCRTPAVYLDREEDIHLCAAHFCEKVFKRVATSLAAEKMVRPGSVIAVALSGGKDSSVLLSLLHGMREILQDVHLVALTVDEGIRHYREETMAAAAALCHQLEVPQVVLSFQERYGRTLDAILVGNEPRACSYCGILRKRLLEEGAREIGADLVATGHSLDDEVQAAVMNVLRGDLSRMIRDLPDHGRGVFIPRIKPLSGLSEREIALYAILSGNFNDLPECPYAGYAFRAEVRTFINSLEKDHPGTMKRTLERYQSAKAGLIGPEKSLPMKRCESCQAPSSGTLCRVCALLSPGIR